MPTLVGVSIDFDENGRLLQLTSSTQNATRHTESKLSSALAAYLSSARYLMVRTICEV